jgi:hypothetical protein
MPLAIRNLAESPLSAGLSPSVGRPLFVPPGILHVRTGPTTAAEFDRLLGVADGEVSGIRSRATAQPSAWLRALAAIRSVFQRVG